MLPDFTESTALCVKVPDFVHSPFWYQDSANGDERAALVG
jgi:hypothetical protein